MIEHSSTRRSFPVQPELIFVVQQKLGFKEALRGSFVVMSFSGSFVEGGGDGIALGLGD